MKVCGGVMMALAAGLLAAAAGCRSAETMENTVAPGVGNKMVIAHVSSVCNDKEYPKEFYVTADPAVEKSEYAGEVVQYTQNGLRGLGLTLLEKPNDKALQVKVNFSQEGDRRVYAQYTVAATVGDKPMWRVNSRCSGRPEYFRNYLPGLVAAAMPNVGRTVELSLTNINRHPVYLKWVMGHFEEKK